MQLGAIDTQILSLRFLNFDLYKILKICLFLFDNSEIWNFWIKNILWKYFGCLHQMNE